MPLCLRAGTVGSWVGGTGHSVTPRPEGPGTHWWPRTLLCQPGLLWRFARSLAGGQDVKVTAQLLLQDPGVGAAIRDAGGTYPACCCQARGLSRGRGWGLAVPWGSREPGLLLRCQGREATSSFVPPSQ